MAGGDERTGGRRGRWALALAALALAAGSTAWRATRGVLEVVNATPFPVRVRSGSAEWEVAPRRQASLILPAGLTRLEVRVGEAEPESLQVELQGGLAGAWGRGPVQLLNPAGAAALLWEEASYGPDGAPEPRPARLHTGAPFLTLPAVDLLFEPFPEQAAAGRLTRLTWLEGPPAAVAAHLPEDTPVGARLDFLEAHLRLEPRADTLLAYGAAARAGQAVERALGFLAPLLERDPVLLPVHRLAQDLRRERGEEPALRRDYARRLAAAPGDAGLRYLLGRVQDDARAALRLYREAAQARPELGDAWRGAGLILASWGQWEPALEAARQARRARASDAGARWLEEEALLGLERRQELAALLEEAARGDPLDLAVQLRRLELARLEGQPGAVAAAQAAWERALREEDPRDLAQRGLLVRVVAAELEGRWEDALRVAAGIGDPARRAGLELRALLGSAREAGLEEAWARCPQEQQPGLALAVGLVLEGRGGDAAPWRRRASEAWARGSGRERRAAALLGRPGAADPEALAAPGLPPFDQACLLLTLAAGLPPGARPPLLERAAPLLRGAAWPLPALRQRLEQLRGGSR